jgi:hypothetical protein
VAKGKKRCSEIVIWLQKERKSVTITIQFKLAKVKRAKKIFLRLGSRYFMKDVPSS